MCIKNTGIIENSHSFNLIEKIVSQDYLIIDFNITDTTKNILQKLGESESKINERLYKVHGCRDSEFIFGVEDDAQINRDHTFLKKASRDSFLSADLEVLKLCLNNCVSIHIFGHSLGNTDNVYFNKFFQDFSNPDFAKKSMNVYNFGASGRSGVYSNIDKMTLNRLSVFRQNVDLKFIDTSPDWS